MTVPLILLAVGSVVAGFLLVSTSRCRTGSTPVFGEPEEADARASRR